MLSSEANVKWNVPNKSQPPISPKTVTKKINVSILFHVYPEFVTIIKTEILGVFL